MNNYSIPLTLMVTFLRCLVRVRLGYWSQLLFSNLLSFVLQDRRGNEGMETLMGSGSRSSQEEGPPALPPRVCFCM